MSDEELKLSEELANISNVNYTYDLSLHKKNLVYNAIGRS